ncbi:MAG: hypothetical protein ACLT9P_06660 [Evtepia gabavorous]
MTMINRVLQRNPQSPEDLLRTWLPGPDNNQDPSQWYYLAIQESHQQPRL